MRSAEGRAFTHPFTGLTVVSSASNRAISGHIAGLIDGLDLEPVDPKGILAVADLANGDCREHRIEGYRIPTFGYLKYAKVRNPLANARKMSNFLVCEIRES